MQEVQVYILIPGNLCLNSPGSFQAKGEKKLGVIRAKEGGPTSTGLGRALSLWAFCTGAAINTWEAFDSHISKTCHKAHAFPLPTDPGPNAKGRGTLTKVPFSPSKAFLMRSLKGDFNQSSHRMCSESQPLSPSSHCAKASWNV